MTSNNKSHDICKQFHVVKILFHAKNGVHHTHLFLVIVSYIMILIGGERRKREGERGERIGVGER